MTLKPIWDTGNEWHYLFLICAGMVIGGAIVWAAFPQTIVRTETIYSTPHIHDCEPLRDEIGTIGVSGGAGGVIYHGGKNISRDMGIGPYAICTSEGCGYFIDVEQPMFVGSK